MHCVEAAPTLMHERHELQGPKRRRGNLTPPGSNTTVRRTIPPENYILYLTDGLAHNEPKAGRRPSRRWA